MDKKQLPDSKMISVLTDIFLMEAYVNEKTKIINTDSITTVKKTFYPKIFTHHKVDSLSFYTTLNYYQSHPDQFSILLSKVDSNLYKIKPLDTAKSILKPIETPKDINNLNSFSEQEEAMRKEYLKKNPALQKLKLKKGKE